MAALAPAKFWRALYRAHNARTNNLSGDFALAYLHLKIFESQSLVYCSIMDDALTRGGCTSDSSNGAPAIIIDGCTVASAQTSSPGRRERLAERISPTPVAAVTDGAVDLLMRFASKSSEASWGTPGGSGGARAARRCGGGVAGGGSARASLPTAIAPATALAPLAPSALIFAPLSGTSTSVSRSAAPAPPLGGASDGLNLTARLEMAGWRADGVHSVLDASIGSSFSPVPRAATPGGISLGLGPMCAARTGGNGLFSPPPVCTSTAASAPPPLPASRFLLSAPALDQSVTAASAAVVASDGRGGVGSRVHAAWFQATPTREPATAATPAPGAALSSVTDDVTSSWGAISAFVAAHSVAAAIAAAGGTANEDRARPAAAATDGAEVQAQRPGDGVLGKAAAAVQAVPASSLTSVRFAGASASRATVSRKRKRSEAGSVASSGLSAESAVSSALSSGQRRVKLSSSADAASANDLSGPTTPPLFGDEASGTAAGAAVVRAGSTRFAASAQATAATAAASVAAAAAAAATSTAFSCDSCPAVFGRPSHLLRHRQSLHLALRPFACDRCPLAFGQSSHLKEHTAAVHERVKQHACATCGAAFSRANHLTRHIVRRH